MRIVLQITAGGKGDRITPTARHGRGSGESYDVATVSPVFKKMSFEQTNLAEWANCQRRTVLSLTPRRKIVSNSMDQFRALRKTKLL